MSTLDQPLPFEPLTIPEEEDADLGEAMELDAQGRAYAAELDAAHADKANAEERIEHASAMLKKLMGDAVEARVDGRPVVTWRPYVRRSFSSRAAKRFLTDEQIAACEVPTIVRPFRRAE